MYKRIIITAALSGISSVVLGAFGAHGLKSLLSVSGMQVWNTAVEYQFYHTLAILFLSTLAENKQLIKITYYSFTFGIILFSGSLYVLAAKEIHSLAWTSFLGPVTPVGGLFFIAGWISLLFAGIRSKYAGVK